MKILNKAVTSSKDVEVAYNEAVAGNYDGYCASKDGKVFRWDNDKKAAVLVPNAKEVMLENNIVVNTAVKATPQVNTAVKTAPFNNNIANNVKTKMEALIKENEDLKAENLELRNALVALEGLV